MISPKLEQALNEQINAETFSAYLYFAKSSWLRSQNLDGCADWMRAQAMEELTHAQKFFDFVEERGGRVILTAIDTPQKDWNSLLNVFEEVLKHELKVTSLIHNLVDMARGERDHATEIFLQWFVTEQVEEEATAEKIISQIKLMENAPGGMFMLDKDLGARTPASVLAQLQTA